MNSQFQNSHINDAALIILDLPGANSVRTFTSFPGATIKLTFDESSVSFERVGDDLSLAAKDGGNILLVDFFKATSLADLPQFVLKDGATLEGGDFLQTLPDDFNLSDFPASGSRSDFEGGGIGEYLSSAGDLIGGVDRLDSLGPMSWDNKIETPDLLERQGVAITPLTPPDPAPQLAVFGGYIRAVLYNPGNSTDPVSTSIFYGNGHTAPTALNPADINYGGNNPSARYTVEVSVPQGWDESWVHVAFNPATGRLEFTLTAAGIAEMERLGLSDQNLIDFIQVTVTDAQNPNAPSFGYNVQIVGTNNPNFNSQDQDAFDQQQGEGYPNHQHESIGEFHQGKDQAGAYDIVSSSKNDEIIINDKVIGGSQIHASGSSDLSQLADDYNAIFLNAGASNQGGNTQITSSDGKLLVNNGVESTGSTADTLIHMGKGEVRINNATGDGVSADDGARNSIFGGTVAINGVVSGVSATSQSSNYVFGKDINLSGGASGVFASGGSINEITGTGGEVVVNGGITGMEALAGGDNNLSAEGGSIQVAGGLHGLHASGAGSKNTVDIDDGTIRITSDIGSALAANGGGKNAVVGAGGSGIIIQGALGLTASGRDPNNNTEASSNSVVATGGTVSITGEQGSAVWAANQASNYVFGKDIDLVTNGEAAAVIASGGSINEITGTGGTVTIQAETGTGIGVEANTGGRNDISAEGGKIEIAASQSGVVANGGRNEIIGEDGASITISGDAEGVTADGLHASNVVTSLTGTVKIVSENGTALSATDQSSNYVFGKDINLSGGGSGVFASGGSINEITGTGGEVVVNGGITGMEALAGGDNNLSAEGGSIQVEGGLHGLHASGAGSKNTVDIDDGTIRITSDIGSALAANGGGKNAVVGAGGSGIIIQGALGLTASGRDPNNNTEASSNSVIATGGTVSITGEQGSAVSAANQASNYVFGQDINLVTNGEAAAVIASDGSINEVTGTGGTVTIQGQTGVEANSGGRNDISAEGGKIEITAQSGVVANGGRNDIIGEGAVTVEITANAETAEKAIAMWANGGGALNYINVDAGSVVNIVAQNGEGKALYATDGGVNHISIDAGSSLNIAGDIARDNNADSGNIVEVTGHGNTVTIDGNVEQGSLNIIANADNTFTLILQASSVADFESRYGDWLNSLNDADVFAGLVGVTFQMDGGWSAEDIAYLEDKLAAFLNNLGQEASFTDMNGDLASHNDAAGFADDLDTVHAGTFTQETHEPEVTVSYSSLDNDAAAADPFPALHEGTEEQATGLGLLFLLVADESHLEPVLFGSVTDQNEYGGKNTEHPFDLAGQNSAHSTLPEDVHVNIHDILDRPHGGSELDLNSLLGEEPLATPEESLHGRNETLNQGGNAYIPDPAAASEYACNINTFAANDQELLVQQHILLSSS